MTDLINRADAIEAVCEWGTNEERKGNLTTTMVSVKQCVADILSALPSAEAVQGEWKCMADCGVTECDQCGWSIEEYVGDYNFCPMCGAVMKGGDSR